MPVCLVPKLELGNEACSLGIKEASRQCKASNFEKPGAVIPYAGICEGQSGNWLFYLDEMKPVSLSSLIGRIWR